MMSIILIIFCTLFLVESQSQCQWKNSGAMKLKSQKVSCHEGASLHVPFIYLFVASFDSEEVSGIGGMSGLSVTSIPESYTHTQPPVALSTASSSAAKPTKVMLSIVLTLLLLALLNGFIEWIYFHYFFMANVDNLVSNGKK